MFNPMKVKVYTILHSSLGLSFMHELPDYCNEMQDYNSNNFCNESALLSLIS